jgi:hypothetical protein
MSDNNILNGLAEYFRRSGRNLADLPGKLSENLSDAGSRAGGALADVADRVPHVAFAQDGLKTLNGVMTGYDTPYYGDDEISAAREQFDREPRSTTSRLSELLRYMPGAGWAPPAAKAAQQAVKSVVPNDLDEAKAIMERFRQSRAENQGAN